MSPALDRLVWVVARLREHCPWTRRLTHDVLTEYLIEEAYEAVEVIESTPAAGWPEQALADGSYERLRLEMGDVLFQVVLHSAIAEGAGGFSFDGTAEAITAKMIRRNPHVFHPDGTLRPAEELAAASIPEIEKTWERVKAAERAAAASAGTSTPDGAATPDGTATPDGAARPDPGAGTFADVPAHLPALAAAAKVVDRAARQPVDPLTPPDRPASGPDGADAVEMPATAPADEAELGATLFTLVQQSRAAGLDPERALRRHLARLRHDLSGPTATG